VGPPEETREVDEPTAAGDQPLSAIFTPRSVAVVGASPTSAAGRHPLENFASLRYRGRVAAVNPRYDEISGFPCYPSLKDLPFVPEAVLVSVNRERAPSIVEQAAEVGARGAVVLAIGFAEAGPTGGDLQRRITEIARAANMDLIGPNCQGVINFVRPCALYLSRVRPYPPGQVALFSQSGNITTTLTNNRRGVRWRHVVSCGNEAVTVSADLIHYFIEDPDTRVICGFMETVRNPEQFFAECDRARAAGKPVVVLKSGRTDEARRAVTAHSGALSAADRLYDELFRRHGVLRVDSIEELLETAIALQCTQRPADGRVAAATGSGGQIELMLDELGRCPALTHPEFEPSTKAYLRSELPEFLAPSNPLDYWGVPDFRATYPKLLGALADDPNVDIVVGVGDNSDYPTGGTDEWKWDAAVDLAERTDKLVAVLVPTDGDADSDSVERLLRSGVLLLSGFPNGFKALDNLVAWSRPAAPQAPHPLLDLDAFRAALDAHPGGAISGADALGLLRLAGIPTAPSVEAESVEQALAAAETIGYPVVAKIGDTTVAHKTERGGVHLGLSDARAVEDACRHLFTIGAHKVLVQPMVKARVEMILGLHREAGLGSFVLVGLGGIWTEIMNDVSLRPVGLREGEAAAMVSELRSQRLLSAVRGQSAVDLGTLIDVMTRLDAVGSALGGRLESVDVNPLVVTDDGILAVDALIVPASPHTAEPHPGGTA
jgi:acetate---CoA ligase (ADP-forming)